jgi:predicted amidohydrolase
MPVTVTVCDFPDEAGLKEPWWMQLVGYVAKVRPFLVILPEMPFCEWIFVGEKVDETAWHEALAQHDRMIGRLPELECHCVMSSRPIEESGGRFNEAFSWSVDTGYVPVRRKWYLPDAPTARESLWFDPGDRNFAPVEVEGVKIGIQLCSEIMLTQHAQEIGFDGAHVLVQPRATSGARRWRVACEMSAIASGCYVASANRRSSASDAFPGGSWILSPDAHLLCETTAELGFATAEIDISTAERAKSQYPRDLLRTYRR